MKNFIAMDFETANNNRSSICAVGFVFVENGIIVNSEYSLINPESEFSYWNTQVHGIYEHDVQGAPTFPEYYERINHLIEGKVLVAHNLSFDGYALRDCLEKYRINQPNVKMLCTLQLAKKLYKGLPSYKLNTLSERFGITLLNHHNALDDAEACAHMMNHYLNETGVESMDQLCKMAKLKYGEMKSNNYFASCVSGR